MRTSKVDLKGEEISVEIEVEKSDRKFFADFSDGEISKVVMHMTIDTYESLDCPQVDEKFAHGFLFHPERKEGT